ncbi:DUF4123 domain-containing protein [Tateyamaria sp. SN6-1]|uniref:DUF4123 domain-containing protein n=1 Tax=Tateyamaria sp. SN6-1 TaxID=3092148 RepID=UPI0039F4730F
MTQDHDPVWDIGSAPPDAGATGQDAAPAYEVSTLAPVAPLDAQMGVADPVCVPDPLIPALFAGPETTFALLDGAKIDNLPERLENSDLPHVCLFDDVETLGAAAPWLVELTQDAPFARYLFTVGRGPRSLWAADTGLFLRSARPLAGLRAHLRRFTQVRSVAEDKPAFFRFWEPRVMARYVQAHDPAARANLSALIGPGALIAVDRHNDRAVVATAGPPETRPPRLWPALRTDMAPIRYEIFCEDLADQVAADIPPLAEVERNERRAVVRALADAARAIGLHLDKSVKRYVYAALMIGGQPETDARFEKIIASPRHELDRSRQILKLAQTLG